MKIEGSNQIAVQYMIEYMYSANLPYNFNLELSSELLHLSDKYNIGDLKSIWIEKISSR